MRDEDISGEVVGDFLVGTRVRMTCSVCKMMMVKYMVMYDRYKYSDFIYLLFIFFFPKHYHIHKLI